MKETLRSLRSLRTLRILGFTGEQLQFSLITEGSHILKCLEYFVLGFFKYFEDLCWKIEDTEILLHLIRYVLNLNIQYILGKIYERTSIIKIFLALSYYISKKLFSIRFKKKHEMTQKNFRNQR